MPGINRPKTVGFIAAGNVAGAGIHEIAIALMAGARVLIKTASAEPIFFAEFARTLAEIDRDGWRAYRSASLGSRADRPDRGDDCELRVGGGVRRRRDDRVASQSANVIGFGSRVSAALIADAIVASRIDGVAESLARDVALFEQLGCLSLHHVFVVSPDGRAARDAGDPNGRRRSNVLANRCRRRASRCATLPQYAECASARAGVRLRASRSSCLRVADLNGR